MPEEEKVVVENKKVDVIEPSESDDDKAFIEALLNPDDEDTVVEETAVEPTAEEKTEAELKKKNSEEAQKRREREAKEKAEKEAKEKAEQEAKEKAEAERAQAEAKKKLEDEARAKGESEQKKESQVLELAKQIADFKNKHPEVDIQKLQKDINFTEYLSGKLLGKKSFTELFDSYSEFVKRVGGKDLNELKKNADKPTSGSANKGIAVPDDVYSEEELKRLAKKLPFMNMREADKISAKINRSIAFYNKK